MADEITKDRSPRSPGTTLEESINLVRKLFDQIRGATVGPDVGVKALGYGGTNGAAMTTLATLGQYGLVDRSKGRVAVTPLAIRILHPKSPEQKEAAIKEAALNPAIMEELYRGFLDCSQSVIEGHLIQNNFTPDRARKVASIHVANKSFAKLTSPDSEEEHAEESLAIDPSEPATEVSPRVAAGSSLEQARPSSVVGVAVAGPVQRGASILAQYSIPLGANQATLVFSGEKLTSEDFDALIDFVEFSKRQFERAQRVVKRVEVPSTNRTYPVKAIWKNKDHDVPVTLLGEMGAKDGIVYYQSETGAGIPGNEIVFEAE